MTRSNRVPQSQSAESAFERRVELLRVLADPVRLRLLALLDAGGEVCVCYLHDALGLPQPTVSRHLAVLREHGLVLTRRDGLWVHYRLDAADPLLRAALAGPEQVQRFRLDRESLDRLTAPPDPTVAQQSCCGPSEPIVPLNPPQKRGRR